MYVGWVVFQYMLLWLWALDLGPFTIHLPENMHAKYTFFTQDFFA